MPNKFKIDALQADIVAVDDLLKQAIKVGDPVGEYQFSKRKKKLEKQLTELNDKAENSASVALFFGGKPVIGSRGIAAEFAGNILGNFQELVSRAFVINELGSIGERGPIPSRPSTNLMVTEIVRGSFGFVLDEMDDQTTLFDTGLKEIVDDVAILLARTASPNEKEFEEILERLDSRTLIALRDFFITLDSNDATFRFVEDVVDFTLDQSSIRRARNRTEATTINDDEIFINGILIGYLPGHKKFEVTLDDGTLIWGPVAKEAADQYKVFQQSGNIPNNDKWKLKIRRRIVAPLNRAPKEIYRLLEFVEKLQ